MTEITVSRRPIRRHVPSSPDGGVIADYQAPVADPAILADWLDEVPGIVEHGLFPPEMVSTVLVGGGDAVQRTDLLAQSPTPDSPHTARIRT